MGTAFDPSHLLLFHETFTDYLVDSGLYEASGDALAISIGNVHRIENSYVEIDFENFDALEQALKLPLVIHGTSCIKPDDIRHLSQRSVCKFNIGTCLRQRFGTALRRILSSDEKLFDRLTIMQKIMPELSDEASQMIELLGQ